MATVYAEKKYLSRATITLAELKNIEVVAAGGRPAASQNLIATFDGGEFRYDPTSVAVADDKDIIAPNVGTGNWLRVTLPAVITDATGTKLDQLMVDLPQMVNKPFTATAGQIIFNLDVPYNNDGMFIMAVGSNIYIQIGVDFTVAGTVVTWNPAAPPAGTGYTMQVGDSVNILYHNGGTGIASKVDSVFGRQGVIVATLGDYLSSLISDDSGVGGATTSASLDILDGKSGVTSVHARTGDVVSATGDYESDEITNNSTVPGASVTSALDYLKTTKSHRTPVDAGSNSSNERTRNIGSTANYNLNFSVPTDFNTLVAAYAVGYVSAGAAQTNRDIDMDVNFNNGIGQLQNQFTASDTGTTFDLSTYSGRRYHLDFSSLLTGITAGATGGINIDHNVLGGIIEYKETVIEYT